MNKYFTESQIDRIKKGVEEYIWSAILFRHKKEVSEHISSIGYVKKLTEYYLAEWSLKLEKNPLSRKILSEGYNGRLTIGRAEDVPFNEKNLEERLSKDMAEAFTLKEILSNRMMEDKLVYIRKNGELVLFEKRKGMKLVKALKSADVLSPDNEKILNSMLNLRAENGDIVLSINPLDIVNMSLNNYDWSTCFRPSGDYPMAVLEVLCSSTPVCCISNKEQLNGALDMKARTIVFASNDRAIYSKIYPYQSNGIIESLNKFLSETYTSEVDFHDASFVNCSLVFFSDLENGYGSNIYYNGERGYEKINILTKPVCYCGKDIKDWIGFCLDCTGLCTCGYCGEVMITKTHEDGDGDPVCDSCWSAMCNTCVDCGREFVLGDSEKNENRCSSCLSKRKKAIRKVSNRLGLDLNICDSCGEITNRTVEVEGTRLCRTCAMEYCIKTDTVESVNRISLLKILKFRMLSIDPKDAKNYVFFFTRHVGDVVEIEINFTAKVNLSNFPKIEEMTGEVFRDFYKNLNIKCPKIKIFFKPFHF